VNEMTTIAQTVVDTVNNVMQPEQNSSSGIQVVMWVTLIVWCGLFLYLVYLDRQIKKVKNKIEIKDQ
jgi:CcmD family protein